MPLAPPVITATVADVIFIVPSTLCPPFTIDHLVEARYPDR
jgi:hypothetical protein